MAFVETEKMSKREVHSRSPGVSECQCFVESGPAHHL